jgi:hypothetical protein
MYKTIKVPVVQRMYDQYAIKLRKKDIPVFLFEI